jgi:hypothetical protein
MSGPDGGELTLADLVRRKLRIGKKPMGCRCHCRRERRRGMRSSAHVRGEIADDLVYRPRPMRLSCGVGGAVCHLYLTLQKRAALYRHDLHRRPRPAAGGWHAAGIERRRNGAE